MIDEFKLDVKKLHEDAELPEYAHPGQDAGLDLVSVGRRLLHPGDRTLVPTGIAFDIPEGWVGLVHPRSGLAINKGLTVLNTPGTIDAGYQGEIKVIVANLGREKAIIDKGERIAQIVFQRVGYARLNPVEEFSSLTERGAGGFGSTGK